jgi:biopolymer transport protein ExbD
MKRLGKAHAEDDTDIDITPMLDVVFIMLIFFIVTASFVKETGIGLNKPDPNQQNEETPDVRPIVVEVNDLNEIRVQNRLVDKRSVKPTIIRLKAEAPDAAVVVKVSPKSKTQTVISAVDGIREANVFDSTVTLSTQ